MHNRMNLRYPFYRSWCDERSTKTIVCGLRTLQQKPHALLVVIIWQRASKGNKMLVWNKVLVWWLILFTDCKWSDDVGRLNEKTLLIISTVTGDCKLPDSLWAQCCKQVTLVITAQWQLPTINTIRLVPSQSCLLPMQNFNVLYRVSRICCATQGLWTQRIPPI